MSQKLRVLYIPAESGSWQEARSASYGAVLGLEEGFPTTGIAHQTVNAQWISLSRKFLGTQRFDQIWISCFHSAVGTAVEWLSELAPVRLGLLMESLNYSPDYTALEPQLGAWAESLGWRMQFLTHIACADEADIDEVRRRWNLPATWLPGYVPERFTHRAISDGDGRAVFSGRLYPRRMQWLREAKLNGALHLLESPDARTNYPGAFDLLHIPVRALSRRTRHDDGGLYRVWAAAAPLFHRKTILQPAHAGYLRALRLIRRRCFALWLEGLSRAEAIVSLPTNVSCYPGRVVEGMAAGRPVIAWEVPNRPRTKSLFEDGHEILLYQDQPTLAAQIERISRDRTLGRSIATRALAKVRAAHTAETRVRQLATWIERGEDPAYP